MATDSAAKAEANLALTKFGVASSTAESTRTILRSSIKSPIFSSRRVGRPQSVAYKPEDRVPALIRATPTTPLILALIGSLCSPKKRNLGLFHLASITGSWAPPTVRMPYGEGSGRD